MYPKYYSSTTTSTEDEDEPVRGKRNSKGGKVPKSVEPSKPHRKNIFFNTQQQVFEGKRHGVQPQNGIPGFSLHFPKELGYGYLRFEGNGKIPLGR